SGGQEQQAEAAQKEKNQLFEFPAAHGARRRRLQKHERTERHSFPGRAADEVEQDGPSDCQRTGQKPWGEKTHGGEACWVRRRTIRPRRERARRKSLNANSMG